MGIAKKYRRTLLRQLGLPAVEVRAAAGNVFSEKTVLTLTQVL
eukprot:UN00948